MSHDGNFDLSDVDPQFWEEWKRPCMRTFKQRSEPSGLRLPLTSAQLFGIEPGPHSVVEPTSVGNAVCKGFVDSTDVVSVAASPRCSIEITCNHDSTDGEDELLGNASPLGVDVADM